MKTKPRTKEEQEALEQAMKKNHIAYTTNFERFSQGKIDRKRFLVNEKKCERIGHALREKLGIYHGIGDIFCKGCGLWFPKHDRQNILDFQDCTQHRHQHGRREMHEFHQEESIA